MILSYFPTIVNILFSKTVELWDKLNADTVVYKDSESNIHGKREYSLIHNVNPLKKKKMNLDRYNKLLNFYRDNFRSPV